MADVPNLCETLIDRLERIAQLHENNVALCSPSSTAKPSQLTYGELLAQTDLRSRALAAYTGAPGDRIAILMHHDIDQASALLSVLRAGRIVVVLNPTDAQSRLRAIVEDAAPAMIIADTAHFELANIIAQDICACIAWDEAPTAKALVPAPQLDAQATAFIVYTSGSSGRPKGVMLNHEQVMHNALRLSAVMELGVADRVALLPSLSGLHGVNTFWCTLLRGATLLPFPVMERGVTGLADWMREREITAFSASTSLFRSYMMSLKDGQQLTSVRIVRIGGELATSDDVLAFQQHFSGDSVLINTLSSSEAGTMTALRCTVHDVVPNGPLAVGRPFDGVEIEIVDASGQPVATGEAGQMIIRSRCVAQGYWRNERLTAERFFRGPSGEPVLHSGDWGRFNSDGILEFVGRQDRRVKIHGWSVEFDEVEWALSRVAGVERVAVCTFEGSYGTELAAYVVPRSGMPVTPATLRAAIREWLPSYMVPAVLQVVDDLPLMPHGKVDRAKLLEMSPPAARSQPHTGFETDTEALVAAIWSEAFGREDIGRDDDFFELGGNSLTASVIAARVFGDTGAELDLEAFGLHPAVASQARLIDRIRGEKSEEFRIQQKAGERTFPLSATQHRIWQFCQTEAGVTSYSLLRRYRIVGPLDSEILRRCMDRLVERHELLRTTFHAGDNGPVQVVHAPERAELSVVDLRGTPDLARAIDEQSKKLFGNKFALDCMPLLRFALLRVADNEHLLLRIVHHMLYDQQTSELYFNELADLYKAEVSGQDTSITSETGPQYGDYANWQQQMFGAEKPAAERLVGWWLKILDAPPEPLDWPAKRLRPAQAVPSEGYNPVGLEPATWQDMAALARQQHVTIFCAWLAAFSAFLCAQTGQREVVVGTYVSNRKRPELQAMFGDFSNLVSLRLRCDLSQTFRSWLMSASNTLTGASAHSELPYEELRSAFLRKGRNLPEIRILTVLSPGLAPVRFANIEFVEANISTRRMPWGFTFHVASRHNDCRFNFDASIYDPNAVQDAVAQWKRLVAVFLRDPDMPIKKALALADVTVVPSSFLSRFFPGIKSIVANGRRQVEDSDGTKR